VCERRVAVGGTLQRARDGQLARALGSSSSPTVCATSSRRGAALQARSDDRRRCRVSGNRFSDMRLLRIGLAGVSVTWRYGARSYLVTAELTSGGLLYRRIDGVTVDTVRLDALAARADAEKPSLGLVVLRAQHAVRAPLRGLLPAFQYARRQLRRPDSEQRFFLLCSRLFECTATFSLRIFSRRHVLLRSNIAFAARARDPNPVPSPVRRMRLDPRSWSLPRR